MYDRGIWLSGGPATVRGFVASRAPLNSPGQFGGFHPDVTVTGVADASVRTLSNSIDPDTFARMTTIAGDQCSMRSNTIHQRREEIQRKRR
jgi:hypothetical protein